MIGWPQILVATWLQASIAVGIIGAVRPSRRSVVITPKQQRIASLAITMSALSEATLLVAGGFWK